MSTILYILLAVLILLFMITIHEFGHYLAGKLLGFKINEFSIGFGPQLYKKTSKKTGELFSVRAFPLGGYCAFEGEDGGSDDKGAFTKQAPWKRIIVLFSGAFFNFLTAIIFCFILLVSVGYDVPKVSQVSDVAQIANIQVFNQENDWEDSVFSSNDKIVKITTIANIDGTEQEFTIYEHKKGETEYSASSIAAVVSAYLQEIPALKSFDYLNNCSATIKSGENALIYSFETFLDSNENILQDGDIIYKVNGKKVNVLHQLPSLLTAVANEGDRTATLLVKRDGKEIDVEVKLLLTGYEGNYSYIIGINTQPYAHTFGEALGRAVPLTFEFSWLVLKTLWQLITGQVAMEAVGGTITTIVVMADYAKQNFKTILVLIPLIAANLAVFNWLPFPALDGAHMVFTGVEWIRKKPINQNVENMIHNIGLWVLLGFVIFADFYQLIIHIIR